MKEEIKKENERESDSINKIYFYKDGNSPWYRAYEWSAFLVEFFPNNKGLKLKCTKRKLRDFKDEVIYAGIQLSSFEKYIPEANITFQSEDYIEITVDLNDYENKNITYENFKNLLSEWKTTVSLTTDKNRKTTGNGRIETIFNSPSTFMGIFCSILKFNIDGKTEEDYIDFIKALKDKCASIIC